MRVSGFKYQGLGVLVHQGLGVWLEGLGLGSGACGTLKP